MPPFAGHSADPIPWPVMSVLRLLCALIVLPFLSQPAVAATLEEMAGQMILVGFEGDAPADAGVKAVVSDLEAGRLGGVMYLKKNVSSLQTVREMNGIFRAASPDLPPFITLDQEGGAVERLTRDVGFTEWRGVEPRRMVVPLILDDAEVTLAASKLLEAEGYLVTGIRPPTVPTGTARLRFTFTAEHDDADIARLASIVREKILPRRAAE